MKVKTPTKITRTYASRYEEYGRNGSDTMMAKPMKALELHYPVSQFLLIFYNVLFYCTK